MQTPLRIAREDGEPRQVGYEFEFAGLEIRQACEAVTTTLGGTVREKTRFSCVVEDTDIGNVDVEYDALALKNRKYLKYAEALGLEIDPGTQENVDELLAKASSGIVPCEIVLPPLPVTAMEPAERLRKALHEARARGTRASLLYAFGLHVNVEPPSLDAATLAAYVQAFALLEDWLRHRVDVDLSRVLTPYVNPYPEAYVRLVADPKYAPEDPAGLADDYLAHNPTRNRALDLLPLLAHLDAERVYAAGVERELVKPRPAFHFRLPNCLVDDPDWRVEREWERWLRVEALAADKNTRERLCRAYQEHVASPLRRLEESWVAVTDRVLHGDGA